MRSLAELPITRLAWRKTGAAGFELQGKDGVYATLSFKDPEHKLARVETDEGAWTLKHLGIMVPMVTVRQEGGATNVAIFHPHALRHGKLQFQDGTTFDWAWLHDKGPGGAFLDAEGFPLVRLQAHGERRPGNPSDLESCEVDLGMAPSARSRQALLAALGWYLILFDHMKELDAVAAETALRL